MATENLKKAAETEKKELDSNFDKAVEEKEKPVSVITVAGKDFEIPSTTPAWVSLFIARHGVGESKEVPIDKYLDFILKVIGNDIIDHMIDVADNNYSAEDFSKDVVQKITSSWQGNEEAEKK